jgi:hypothetical protein
MAALSDRGYSEPGLQSALDRLAEADILIAEGVGEQTTYRFKHALIQDAALREPAQEPPPGAAPPRRRSPAR